MCGKSGYTLQTVDITPFADGNSHTLLFYSLNFGTNGGASNFFVDDIEITTGPPFIVADFTADITEGNPPIEVQFTDQSTSTGTITSWSWDFGDSGTSTEQNPVYTYERSGVYTVSLTAEDSEGSDIETKENFITVKSIVADFTADVTEGNPPLEVQFTDQSTSIDSITSWRWDFGDGSTSTEQHPIHTYERSAFYTVSLIATGPAGSDAEIKEDFIAAKGIVADFTVDATEGDAPFVVQFSDDSTSTDTISSWSWDFGDGSTSTEQNPAHTYDRSGVYSVSLTVTGPEGSDTKTEEDFITVTTQTQCC